MAADLQQNASQDLSSSSDSQGFRARGNCDAELCSESWMILFMFISISVDVDIYIYIYPYLYLYL